MKVVHKLAEEGRIAIRHARTIAREQLKLNGVSEDDVKHAEKDPQKVHDDYMVDDPVKHKEAEIIKSDRRTVQSERCQLLAQIRVHGAAPRTWPSSWI